MMTMPQQFRPDAAPLPILVCFSHLRWDSVVQRPHHLMGNASRLYRVVFWEEPVAAPAGEAPGVATRRIADGITVATPRIAPGMDEAQVEAVQVTLLDDLIAGLGGRVQLAWFYTPMMLPLGAHLAPAMTVYDCMDELSQFRGASLRLSLLERRLLRQSDLMFAGGRSLYEAKRKLHPQAHLFPSSVDAVHFGAARDAGADLADPADQAGLARPRVGFHGVVDERMDLDLLAGVAQARPDWQFVMLGPVVKIDPESLPRLPNIHWLGSKPYSALPSYLAGWQAGFMPFALNEATRFISPTKTPEFLAAGLPVVSTPIEDVVRDWGEDGTVEIARGAEQMVTALQRVMTRPAQAWRTHVDRRLQRMSWAATWERMHRLILAGSQTKQNAPPVEQHNRA